jgi:hypothetical protein
MQEEMAMRICPECGRRHEERLDACPECGTSFEPEPEAMPPWRPLANVYRAPDEIAAIAVKYVLEGAGITSWARSIQIPWYDNLMKFARGYWGDILVAEEDREDALRVVGEYLDRVAGRA